MQVFIFRNAHKLKQPVLDESRQVYEVDELYASVAGKLCFVIYN
ncbi:hypothetical protein [Paraflavitalea speifideaquila]|nr:hypothetical protein [Paraflavitalea speifideiaquila]